MTLYEDSRVCLGCGRMGVTRWNCPSCRWCNYCKQNGHIIFQCPEISPCPHCGVKGHKPEKCNKGHPKLSLPQEAQLQANIPVSSEKSVPAAPRLGDTAKQDDHEMENAKFWSRLHDDRGWFVIPEDIRNVST